MVYKITLTLFLTLFLGLGQIYPPPGDGTATPDATETAIPFLVTVTPDAPTPYPVTTPTIPAPIDFSRPTNGDEAIIIGSGNQPEGSSGAATAGQSSATRPESGSPLFLWLAFVAGLTIFVAGIAGSILLFTRKHLPKEAVHHGPARQ